MKAYLEYKDENSSKFWEIETSGISHTVRFGKIGTKGNSKTKKFDSVEKTEKDAEKLKAVKLKKGYTEVGQTNNVHTLSSADVEIINGQITEYKGAAINIRIPHTIDNKIVTEIGNYSFMEKGIEELVISEGITKINKHAFANNKIVRLVLPKSLKSISLNAFDINKLKDLDIPDGVFSIGFGAFNRNELKAVAIPDSVFGSVKKSFDADVKTYKKGTLIPDDAKPHTLTPSDVIMHGGAITEYIGSSTNIIIPKNIDGLTVSSIGEYAFEEGQLTNVVIPEGVITIGKNAFTNNKLTEVTLPDGLNVIEEYAFAENNLTEINIPNSVTIIEKYAFHKNKLQKISLSKNVEVIEKAVFYYNNLEEIFIPEGVKTIGNSAFEMNKIKRVEIPPTVTSIQACAFLYNKLESLAIAEGVKEIGTNAFRSNLLKDITIANSVHSIGDGAFKENKVLRISLHESVDIDEEAFDPRVRIEMPQKEGTKASIPKNTVQPPRVKPIIRKPPEFKENTLNYSSVVKRLKDHPDWDRIFDIGNKKLYEENVKNIVEALKGTINFKLDTNNTSNCLSKIGGLPLVSGTFEWPRRYGKPLTFLAQFNLREVSNDTEFVLPAEGMIYFFVGTPARKNDFVVFYTADSLKEYTIAIKPDDLSEKKILKEQAVIFSKIPVFDLPRHIINTFEGCDELLCSVVNELSGTVDTNEDEVDQAGVRGGKLLGIADNQQDYLDHENYRLLFQCEGEDIGWGGDASLYFTITERDLKSGYFDRVKFEIQGT